MASLMSAGKGKRRCDASCTKAKTPECACICGGRYHGTGNMAVPQLARDLEDGTLNAEQRQAVITAARADKRFATTLRIERDALRIAANRAEDAARGLAVAS